MALYYLIPNSVDGKQDLQAGQVAISAAIQPGATETVSKVKLISSKKSQLFIQHSHAEQGAFGSYNPDTGITVDETERELYYYRDIGQWLRCQVNNEEGALNQIKLWIDTDADPIYCKPEEVFSIAGIDNTVVEHTDVMRWIVMATAEVDRFTGQIWNSRQVTETFNGNSTNVIGTRKFPILTVDSLTVDGTSITTSTLNIDADTGQVGLDTQEGSEKSQYYTDADGLLRNSITYTWGRSETPQEIRKLTAAIAGIMALTEQTGGTYDDITSYSIGDRDVSVGEPWVNIENAMKHLEKMVKEIRAHIPKPFNVY